MRVSRIGFIAAFFLAQLARGGGTITGTVIKAGTAIRQPLSNARLELKGNTGVPLVARTDLNGTFVFPNLPPGEYRLAVTCDGFIRQETPNRIVLQRDQQAVPIVFQLEPAPTAAGSVLDSFGEPVANVMVEALRRSYDVRGNPRMTRAATASTDDRGAYRIFWLDPGDYFFYAASPLPGEADSAPETAVAPTYFPGVSAPEDAKSVRVDIGQEVRIDFRLQHSALWNVNGQTMSSVTGRSVAAGITLAPPQGDPSFSRYQAQSSAVNPDAGQFVMDRIVPGTYILTASTGTGDRQISAVQRIVLRPLAVAPREGYGITLTLAPPLSINGRLFVESGEAADLRMALVTLASIDPDLPSPPAALVGPNGVFAVAGVAPGSYVIDTSNLPGDLYLKAARFGEDDILEKPLTLGNRDAPKPLQVLLGFDGGHVEVGVVNSKGESQGGAHVVLVPDAARRYRREQYRAVDSGEDGKAVFRGVPPGTYTVFAWEHLDANGYLNSDFIQMYEASGVSLKTTSGDNAAVSVLLIPKE